ncbi:MAG: lysophospholipid acyltransferase family protein [Alphaproteobacteria bacterium]
MARNTDRYWQKPTIQHRVEIALSWPIYALLHKFPVGCVGNILAGIGRTIGPRISLSDRIRENVRLVWPDTSPEKMEEIVQGVWDNFSRVISDYWSLDQIRRDCENRLEIIGAEHLDALRKSGRSGIFLAGHLGNWEMVTLAARMHDLPLTVVYRPFNNPFIDSMVRRWQRGSGVELIMKGREGARRLTQVLKGDGHTIMLVDVRMNEGINIPFLGIDAMTPTAPAALAMKYDALLIPVRVERMSATDFRLTVEEPRPAVNTGNRNADIEQTMTWINDRFSAWITARPEQWMWFHRRWGKNPKRPD